MPRDLRTLMPPPLQGRICTECGAEVPPCFSSCDELFMSLLTPLGMTNVDLPEGNPLVRLFVDAFAMQHPARSCRSSKSYAAHITGLCCGIEHGGSQAMYSALQRWLHVGLPRPTEPAFRGELTVRYVYDAGDGEEQARRIHEWAEDVWRAYAARHELVRGWVQQALSASAQRGKR